MKLIALLSFLILVGCGSSGSSSQETSSPPQTQNPITSQESAHINCADVTNVNSDCTSALPVVMAASAVLVSIGIDEVNPAALAAAEDRIDDNVRVIDSGTINSGGEQLHAHFTVTNDSALASYNGVWRITLIGVCAAEPVHAYRKFRVTTFVRKSRARAASF